MAILSLFKISCVHTLRHTVDRLRKAAYERRSLKAIDILKKQHELASEEVRECEERSDELSRRVPFFCGCIAVSDAIDTTPFAARFAHRSCFSDTLWKRETSSTRP